MADDTRRADVFPEVVFLGKLVDRVAAGRIRVPKFQRAFVWTQPDLAALLDSVLRGFPIGAILVWDTEKDIESESRVGPVPIPPRVGGSAEYLLDGQQRVSALAGTLLLTDDMERQVDQIDWRLYYDLDRPAADQPAFVNHPKRAGNPEPQYFPVRSLLNTAEFFTACRRIQREAPDENRARRWLDEADRLSSAFRDYQISLIHIREADLESAVTVFARLNRTGRKMAADDLVSALTYQEGKFHLASMLDEFQVELRNKGFGKLKRVFLLRSVLAALELDIYAKDWANLLVRPEIQEKLPDGFEAAKRGITGALEMLRKIGVTSDRLLPYGLQLVLLGEFHRIRPQPDASTVELLTRWFWVTSFTGWFGGGNPAQARHAVEEIRRLAQGRNGTFEVVDLETAAHPFPERFDGRSARVRAFLLYLASLRPLSLRDHHSEHGNVGAGVQDKHRLDPGSLLSRRGPDALGYLWSNPDPPQKASSPANRLFVDEDHVGQALGALAALDDAALEALLPTHGFPLDAIGRLRNDDRGGLLEARLAYLIDGERAFMEQRQVRLPVERTAPTIADSEASDDE